MEGYASIRDLNEMRKLGFLQQVLHRLKRSSIGPSIRPPSQATRIGSYQIPRKPGPANFRAFECRLQFCSDRDSTSRRQQHRTIVLRGIEHRFEFESAISCRRAKYHPFQWVRRDFRVWRRRGTRQTTRVCGGYCVQQAHESSNAVGRDQSCG